MGGSFSSWNSIIEFGLGSVVKITELGKKKKLMRIKMRGRELCTYARVLPVYVLLFSIRVSFLHSFPFVYFDLTIFPLFSFFWNNLIYTEQRYSLRIRSEERSGRYANSSPRKRHRYPWQGFPRPPSSSILVCISTIHDFSTSFLLLVESYSRRE